MFLLMGSHLFSPKILTPFKDEKFVMIEDYDLCRHYKYHKHKLILFLEGMRNHKDLLIKKGFHVEYSELNKKNYKRKFFTKLKKILHKHKDKSLISFAIEDRFFKKSISDFCKKNNISWQEIDSPLFMHSEEEIKNRIKKYKRPFMKSFYEKLRKDHNILMHNNKPVGGKFSFDEENRKPLAKNIKVPVLKRTRASKHRKDVVKIIDDLFMDHPGECENFYLPTTRNGAVSWLDDFFKKRFARFGPYEDAISKKHPFLFHSVLSPLMNIGLLTPSEVIDKSIDFAKQKKIPTQSLEGFLRQIMGWREFIKGIDNIYGKKQERANFFKHKRKLTSDWYDGTTGIIPLDDCIKKANDFAYCHHIERLMIIANIMLLSEISPKEVFRWFMELFVDSADWVMGPNVYGMGIFSDGGIFATKPYICGSNYILKMSDYERDDWCDILDGLYWRFIHKHRTFFKTQARLHLVVSALNKMNKEKKKKLFKIANDFIMDKTK